jgi:hypothetical protein
MANGHGGKRTPANPAPVSGPGALSRRTDGQPAMRVTGMPYGENADFYDLQQQAPMSRTSVAPRGSAQGGTASSTASVVPLFDATQRPNEPVTSGAVLGPGPGPAPAPTVRPKASTRLYLIAQYDTTGEISAMADILASRGL